jgi:hypothetical protein
METIQNIKNGKQLFSTKENLKNGVEKEEINSSTCSQKYSFFAIIVTGNSRTAHENVLSRQFIFRKKPFRF